MRGLSFVFLFIKNNFDHVFPEAASIINIFSILLGITVQKLDTFKKKKTLVILARETVLPFRHKSDRHNLRFTEI